MTSPRIRLLALAAAVATLGACAFVPAGPSIMVLPGTGKSFDQFRYDDASCRQYANVQVGGATAESAATDSAVRSAALGTAIGAATGAAFGGNSQAAGAGAAAGLLFGSAAGASSSYASGYAVQQRYDNAYVQCMYASGHRVPVSGQFTGAPAYSPTYSPVYAPVQRGAYPPPPPPPPPSTQPPPPAPQAPR